MLKVLKVVKKEILWRNQAIVIVIGPERSNPGDLQLDVLYYLEAECWNGGHQRNRDPSVKY